jgi:hypothetical protein
VTHAVENALASLTPALNADGITVYPRMHRPANFIERALANIQRSLIIAAVMIFIVLFAFLLNWRSAVISFLAIPLSLVAGADALGYMGHTLNTMTLGGFAVALGVLVDDAIIGIENVLRRLRENASAAKRQPRLDVIRDATLEIRGPVIYATIAVSVGLRSGADDVRRAGPLPASARHRVHAVGACLPGRGADGHTRAVCADAFGARRAPRGLLDQGPQMGPSAHHPRR